MKTLQETSMDKRYGIALALGISVLIGVSTLTPSSQSERSESSFKPNIPKTWDDAALADWATPLAGLNARPTTISEKEYYSLPVENVRTYPVYYPGREPQGYWEMLQRIGPQPLIEPEKLKSEADWIEAGRRVFDESDSFQLRSLDPRLIAQIRSRELLEQQAPNPCRTAPSLSFAG